MTVRARLALSIIAFASVCGCEGEPRRLGWEMRFADDSLLAQAAVVQARIRRGSCVGEIIFTVEISRGEPLTGVEMPLLEDGSWGFEARARDATCSVFAEGCTQEDLPIVGPVAVILESRSPVQACSASECNSGRCDGMGGLMDAGTGCAATETSCDNRTDDDCDGSTDCSDSDCAADPGCAACTGVMCPECQTCVSDGSCQPAPEGETCTGGSCHGGSCCTGCWDGSTCQAGAADTACGTGGGACQSCGECGNCDGTACVGVPATEGMPCGGGTGVCAMGACCAGCVGSDGSCQTGDLAAACGTGGVTCDDCGVCGQCIGARCTSAAGATCPGGICQGGMCCTGCLRGSTCEPGNTNLSCGAEGRACVGCGGGETCVGGFCVTDACMIGMMAGRMRTPGVCCTGCFDGAMCQAGGSNTACGSFGRDCLACPARTMCNGVFCEPEGGRLPP